MVSHPANVVRPQLLPLFRYSPPNPQFTRTGSHSSHFRLHCATIRASRQRCTLRISLTTSLPLTLSFPGHKVQISGAVPGQYSPSLGTTQLQTPPFPLIRAWNIAHAELANHPGRHLRYCLRCRVMPSAFRRSPQPVRLLRSSWGLFSRYTAFKHRCTPLSSLTTTTLHISSSGCTSARISVSISSQYPQFFGSGLRETRPLSSRLAPTTHGL